MQFPSCIRPKACCEARSVRRPRITCPVSWFDAHLWAYADHYGLEEIVSEDFQHDRLYGSVRIRNPFV